MERRPLRLDVKLHHTWGHTRAKTRTLENTKPYKFKKGNKAAAREKMSPESHARRMAGLYKTWGVQERQRRGERPMTTKHKRTIQKVKRERIRLNTMREAREIMNIARQYAEASMHKLAEIIANPQPNDQVAVSAINALLERAYGKATATMINATMDVTGKAQDVTGKELDTRIKEALTRVEELAGRAREAPPSEERPDHLRKLN